MLPQRVARGGIALDEQASTSGRCLAPSMPSRRHHRRQPQPGPRDSTVTRAKTHDFSLWRGETPIPKGWSPSVVPGAKTTATPMLTPEKVIERLYNAKHENSETHYGAFYSSELGGITTDPALMLIHMDDHMVHRGHGVFDTALITDGFVYQLPRHLERLKRSAEAAGLALPRSDEAIMRIILDTAAASKKLNGIVKFWLTPGRGGFGLSTRECVETGFYALASSEIVPKRDGLDRLAGFKACTAAYAPVGAPFATIKSNNYLRNALSLLDAEQRGYDMALFVDEAGYVQEGQNMNFGIITQEDVLVTPPAEGCLGGITMERILELIPEEVKRSPDDVVVRKIERRQIHVKEVAAAKEAFVTSSTLRCMAVVSLDETPIADGQPGITALAFDSMLVEDMKPGEDGTPEHIAVPYGVMTGMRDQLT